MNLKSTRLIVAAIIVASSGAVAFAQRRRRRSRCRRRSRRRRNRGNQQYTRCRLDDAWRAWDRQGARCHHGMRLSDCRVERLDLRGRRDPAGQYEQFYQRTRHGPVWPDRRWVKRAWLLGLLQREPFGSLCLL
jgi:hypothetical protein